MKAIITYIRRHKVGTAITLLVLTIVTFAAVRVLPSSTEEMKQSAAIVETRTCWEISVGGKGALWFAAADSDSTLLSPSATRREAERVTLSGGCWMNRWPAIPSCRGRLITVLPQPSATDIVSTGWKSATVRKLMEKARHDIGDSLKLALSEDSELQYYLRVHGVQDEGYQQIAAAATMAKAKIKRLEATAATIGRLLDSTALPLTLRRRITHTIHYRNADGKDTTAACRLVAKDTPRRLSLLQTLDATTPSCVTAQYLLPWNSVNRRLVAVGFSGLGIAELATPNAAPALIEGHRKGKHHDFPRVLAANGCPLFTPRGLFAGIVEGPTVDGRSHVARLMMKGGWR